MGQYSSKQGIIAKVLWSYSVADKYDHIVLLITQPI